MRLSYDIRRDDMRLATAQIWAGGLNHGFATTLNQPVR
jgi:hypothetical protein